MAQIKIYGVREKLIPRREQLSDVIHSCVMDALHYPAEKRFHRFIPLDRENFIAPNDRSDDYLIIEISLFEGRSVEAKKHLIGLLFERIAQTFSISQNDIEITIFETPRHNWGIRGKPGDELDLNYKVDV
jgi:phenylpyruvate tautomerase PptA (4-oxalocrotonate tautomerase family)